LFRNMLHRHPGTKAGTICPVDLSSECLVRKDVGKSEWEPEESKHEDPELVRSAIVDLWRNRESATGTAHRATELQPGLIVDLEVNDEPPALDVLLQRALEGRGDGLAPRPRAVVGTVRVRLGAALIEGELPRCMRDRFHRAREEEIGLARL